jgi:hypothetical protein
MCDGARAWIARIEEWDEFDDGQSVEFVEVPIDKPWGKQWHSRLTHGDYCCKRCDWKVTHSAREQMRAIIGFSMLCPPRIPGRTPAVGCLIYECPHCGNVFWNHIEAEGFRVCQKMCLHWPKELMLHKRKRTPR